MSAPLTHSSFVDVRRRHILIVGIFDVLDRSGVRPVAANHMHMIWYLANALAPAWGIKPFDSALLKTEHQPYFPSLQSDLECLVGMGMLVVTALAPQISQGRLQARFELNRLFADRVLSTMSEIEEETNILNFLDEVVQASNRLSEAEQSIALSKDATYGDPSVEIGNVVDLGEWLKVDQLTPTADVLRRIGCISEREMKPAEAMDIYVDHLGRRLQHG